MARGMIFLGFRVQGSGFRVQGLGLAERLARGKLMTVSGPRGLPSLSEWH